MNSLHFAAVFAAAASLAAGTARGPAAPKSSRQDPKPVIVLVHGAFVDASGWGRVILLLEKDGYTVVAPQNQMASLAEDIATTKRMIDGQTGPVIVVGHSYGGAVITGAAAGNANVKALVYIATYAPEAGEKLGELNAKAAASPLGATLVPDSANFLYIDRAKFHGLVCADLSDEEARVMAATQKPFAAAIFGQSLDNPAWKAIPCWYLVSQEDHVVNPDLERLMAKRMGAHTSEIKSSHLSFMSHAGEITKLIEEAANTTAK
jgi:pimeloyl-ACP methyl ester carboxylesterase